MLIPVVLSGGVSTYPWPMSREGQPKPLMHLSDGQTLLGKAYRRAAGPLAGYGEIVAVTNREHCFQSKDQLQAAHLGWHRGHFILESTGCNTAPAITVAALALQAEHGDAAALVVMPADHLIRNEGAFREAVRYATRLAVAEHLVIFDAVPDVAEIGFDYIELGDRLNRQGAAKARRFVEKPDEETTRRYAESGGFLWNSGMLCFMASTLVDKLAQHAPVLLEQVRACLAASVAVKIADGIRHELADEAFVALSDISIDYVLMERSA